MNISELKDWLSNPVDYQRGCDLLEPHEPNKLKLYMLRLYDSNQNNNYIIDALSDIVKNHESVQIADTGIYTGNDYSDAPSEIKEKVERVKELYKENGHLHSRLLLMKTDEERAVAANTILDNDDVARDLLDQIDYYKINKKIRPTAKDAAEESLSLADMILAISRLRSKISKDKRKGLPVDELENQLQHLLNCKERLS